MLREPNSLTVGLPPASHHRTDIQGMRAIAVVLVLGYHAGVPAFAGGYIGVDVFFVISGFLITGLMVREVSVTGEFDVVRFYRRRARRLLPATAVVLASTSALTLLILPATRWESIAADIRSSALYVVNWRFARQSVDYLTSDAAASPLQHFWSLAVEEQFYVVWPVLLLLLLRFSQRRGVQLSRTLLAGIVFVSVASFVWSVYLTHSAPGSAFFMSTTRAWEFGVGGSLALGAAHAARLPKIAATTLGWTAISVIVIAVVLYDDTTRFPGYTALAPTIATAALIVAGLGRPDGTLQRILSLGPMQWMGDMSYSLYLWHWPLLVMATWLWGSNGGPLSVAAGLAVVAASFVPAWLSFRLVESPIRYSARAFRFPHGSLALGATCTLIGLAAAISVKASIPTESAYVAGAEEIGAGAQRGPLVGLGAVVLGDDPTHDPDGDVVDTVSYMIPSPVGALKDLPSLGGESCIQGPSFSELAPCDYGPPDAETVVALVGDSKMAQWLPAIERVADERGWRVLTFLVNRCALARIPVISDPTFADDCMNYNDARYAALLERDDIDYVVTSQRTAASFIPDISPDMQHRSFVADLQQTWQDFEASGTEVIVLLDNATPLRGVPECVVAHPSKLSECAFEREDGIAASAAPVQLEASRGIDGVSVVDVQDWICPGEVCPVVIGNVLIYRQGSHLTSTYVRSLSTYLDAALMSAMADDPTAMGE